MLGAWLLRQPPALRSAIEPKKPCLSWTQYGATSHPKSLKLHARYRNGRQCSPNGQLGYASDHAGGTNQLSSQRDKDPLAHPSETGGKVSGLTYAVENRPSPTSPSTSDPNEINQVFALSTRRQRRTSSVGRRHFSITIRDALQSIDQLPTRGPLAYGQSRTLQSADPTTSKEATVPAALPATANAQPSTIPSENNVDAVQLVDVGYIQRHKPLPTKEEYPDALDELFQPATISTAIHNACSRLQLSLHIEVDFKPKDGIKIETLNRMQPGLQSIKICELKLEIPDVCQEITRGEGINKQVAKQAAWLLMASKLHVAGMLKELFPTEPRLLTIETVDDTSDSIIETVTPDDETMELEKDAKVEIYNYAASLGLVPQFETELIRRRTPKARFGQTLKRPKPLCSVRIQLPELGIDVSSVNVDLSTAEIAACIAFKEQAERRYKAADGKPSSPPQSAFSILNVDTASNFLEFYKYRQSGLNLEVEHDAIEQPMQRRTARLTMNGNQIGDLVVMRTKKQAESVAFLTAAIEIATSNPSLLNEFAQTLNKGKGKVLRPLDPIDLEPSFDALQSMRSALVEARNSGLTDARLALDAEPLDKGERQSRMSRSLSHKAHQIASAQLLSRQHVFDRDPGLEELRLKKKALPMNQYSQQLLSMIQQNQYSIVIGATSSGKTTQVPQIIFEDSIRRGLGSTCNVICTQPRRIAATSVARRVAVERNERLRQTVGHHVRFEPKLPKEPYGITYCTTGVLLEKLKHDLDNTLDGASHIIIDEVHERDLSVDFLMILLKRAIQSRQAEGRPIPKVVLMSATVDPDLFTRYFQQEDQAGKMQPCPTINVPGRTHPVKELYLGSIMDEMITSRARELIALLEEDKRSLDYLEIETKLSANQSLTSFPDKPKSIIDWKRECTSQSQDEGTVHLEEEESLVPIALVAAAIAHICKTTADGAILAFLPGLEEIVAVQKMLVERKPFSMDFSNGSDFQIHLLHSSVLKEQQAEVFRPSPNGCRKIILSTNIAETSITVPEVKYVVDTGKLRETRYDQIKRITRLQCVWESKANLKQRAGRAGRIQDGFYYALFSKERADSLRAVGLPELLRSDLQATCLSVQAQNFGQDIASFLSQAIEPPSETAIDVAIGNLVAIEAFTHDHRLTALGRVLSRLPVHPTLGKMIVLGVIFRCLDPMIILGAAAEERSLFARPIGLRNEANTAHKTYAGDSQSDHIAFLNAFDELRTIRDEFGIGAASRRANEQYLHMGAFHVIDQTARQIEEVLEQSGLLVADGAPSSTFGPLHLNHNSMNHELIKGLLLAGFRNLAAKPAPTGRSFRTSSEASVLIHPASFNAQLRRLDNIHAQGTLSTYSTLSRSADAKTLFMRGSTIVTPLMAILFGGHVHMSGPDRLEVDGWIPFFVKASEGERATKLILEFRKALDRVLNASFSSLSGLEGADATRLAYDTTREQLLNRVVEVLG